MNAKPAFSLADAVACVPLAGYAVLMAFVFVAYLQVGHWPTYSNPDPKDVMLGHFPVGAYLPGVLLLFVAPTVPIGTLMVLIHAIDEIAQRGGALARPLAMRLIVRTGTCVAVCIVFLLQLGGLVNWLLD
jgi:hypothetical protein